MIEPGQVVGDIIREADFFTTFARIEYLDQLPFDPAGEPDMN